MPNKEGTTTTTEQNDESISKEQITTRQHREQQHPKIRSTGRHGVVEKSVAKHTFTLTFHHKQNSHKKRDRETISKCFQKCIHIL